MKYLVMVKAGSKQEKVIFGASDRIVVYTHARAHDGEANRKVVEMLAKCFGVAKGQVRILRGEKSRMKVVGAGENEKLSTNYRNIFIL